METAVDKPKRVVGRPFQKGVSGNPSGKPKGAVSLSRLIREELGKPTANGTTITKAEIIATKLVNLAEAGDLGAIKEVLDRLEGKSVSRNETGDPGAFTGLEDTPTPDLLKFVEKDSA